MTEPTPTNTPGPAPARRAWVALAITLAATAAATVIDRGVYELFNAPNVYEKDLGRLLRVMGFAGTWVALALAVGLHADAPDVPPGTQRRRGWLLFWSPLLAGALAEVLKIVVRRERPAVNDGAYGFRPWDERTFSGAGLAFPSSHTAVAFGGAFMLARLFPRARWVGLALAAGCGITRILARAHFVSDVVFAAGLGWFVSWLLWRRWRPQAAALLLVVLTAIAPAALPAQAVGQRDSLPSPAAGPACLEYERCALGLRASSAGLEVIRGREEASVARLGFILPGAALDAAFAGDTLAQRYGREARQARRIGALATVGGLLTLTAAAFVAIDAGASEGLGSGLAAAGAAQMYVAGRFQFRADNLLSRAVWTYNRRFSAR